ncbi:MAG: site-specific DNA-methyltransferase [Sedimentibacter sp.]
MNDNLIIKGDNHIVLEKLKTDYSEKVKCVYIDPPYNNGDIYQHYNDNSNSDEWLDEMEIILRQLYSLLSEDGSLWISIDDNEVHYLKVLADSVMGRNKFITTIIWQQRTTRENRKVFSNNHEYILVYAKKPEMFKSSRNLIKLPEDVLKRYKNPDNDPRGPWQSVSANAQAGHAVPSQFYEITAPNGKVHNLPQGRCWSYNKQKMESEIENNNIWFGLDGNGVPRIKKFLKDARLGITPETLWLAEEVGTNKSAKKHLISMKLSEKLFETPKPEELIKKIFDIATNPGDLVLDAYLGSGTTAAVAHKMYRKYIGIEIGEQMESIVIPRLDKVISGEQGGISKEVEWQGGGSFKYLDMSENKIKIAQ